MRKNFALIIAGLACAAAGGTPASATSFVYSDFSSTAGLSLVGNAATTTTGDGTVLRIIPSASGQAGAAYSTTPATLGPGATFSTQFTFRFTQPGGVDPADGITFVLAGSPNGLGGSGFAMGYAGVPNSLAIEFDTYNNGILGQSLGYFSAEPNSSNHVSVDVGGALTNSFATNVYGNGSCGFSNGTPAQNSYAAAGCMSNGDLWTATIGYDGSALSVALKDAALGNTFHALTNVPIDIASILGGTTAYVGFTGSSGAGWENEDIVSWQFADSTRLGPSVPEPVTWAMMLVGFGAVGAEMRRRAGNLARLA